MSQPHQDHGSDSNSGLQQGVYLHPPSTHENYGLTHKFSSVLFTISRGCGIVWVFFSPFFFLGGVHFNSICSIFEYEPLIVDGICNSLVLELFM